MPYMVLNILILLLHVLYMHISVISGLVTASLASGVWAGVIAFARWVYRDGVISRSFMQQ